MSRESSLKVLTALRPRDLRILINTFEQLQNYSDLLGLMNEAMDIRGRDTKVEAALLSPIGVARAEGDFWYGPKGVVSPRYRLPPPKRGWRPVLSKEEVPTCIWNGITGSNDPVVWKYGVTGQDEGK